MCELMSCSRTYEFREGKKPLLIELLYYVEEHLVARVTVREHLVAHLTVEEHLVARLTMNDREEHLVAHLTLENI